MDTKLTPRQSDIDRRLRDQHDTTLLNWLTEQKADSSFAGMSHTLRDLTGDTVSDETLRLWCKALDVAETRSAGAA